MNTMNKLALLVVASLMASALAASPAAAVSVDPSQPVKVTITQGRCVAFCTNEEANLYMINSEDVILPAGTVKVWVVWCQIGSVGFAQVNPTANDCLVGTPRCDISNLCRLYAAPKDDVRGGLGPKAIPVPTSAAATCAADLSVAVLGNTVIENQYILTSCHTEAIEFNPRGTNLIGPFEL